MKHMGPILWGNIDSPDWSPTSFYIRELRPFADTLGFPIKRRLGRGGLSAVMDFLKISKELNISRTIWNLFLSLLSGSRVQLQDLQCRCSLPKAKILVYCFTTGENVFFDTGERFKHTTIARRPQLSYPAVPWRSQGLTKVPQSPLVDQASSDLQFASLGIFNIK